MNTELFNRQFTLSQRNYLSELDFFTWTRHFHVLRELVARVSGDVLEVGTGDGVLRRCVQPFMSSYVVLDINAALCPDFLGDIRQVKPDLVGHFDAIVATEVLEHLPFVEFPLCLSNLCDWLKPGGLLYLTLPHRKGHMMVVTPRQRLLKWRFPVGFLSVSEAYNRFVRRRIWIDPHHCWEIGDGSIRRGDVEKVLRSQGWRTEHFEMLPYCDFWVLCKTV